MARLEMWLVDDDHPTGAWVWAGGIIGGGGTDPDPDPPPATTMKYLKLPGTSGAMASVADSAALRLTSSHRIRMLVRKADWTPTANEVIFARWGDSGDWSYFWRLQTTGGTYFQFTQNGSTVAAAPTTSAPSPALAVNDWIWVEWRLVAASRQVLVATHDGDVAADPVDAGGYSTVVTGGTGAAMGAMYSGGTQAVTIGGFVDGSNMQIDIAQIFVLNASDAVVFSLDPANWTTGTSWTTDSSHVVTLVGTATIDTVSV